MGDMANEARENEWEQRYYEKLNMGDCIYCGRYEELIDYGCSNCRQVPIKKHKIKRMKNGSDGTQTKQYF